MASARSISYPRMEHHELQSAPTAEQRGASEHFDRSMVAQLGSVPQPEQQEQQQSMSQQSKQSQPAVAVSGGSLSPLTAMGDGGCGSLRVEQFAPEGSFSSASHYALGEGTTFVTPPRGVRIPVRRVASVASEEPRRGRRSPSRRPCFPDTAKAMHEHIPMDPSATDIGNLNIMVPQQQFDREHMLALKAAIE